MTILEEQQTSVELVLEAQQGDRAAFGQLVERYEHAVFAIAMRKLGNYAEAQELVQEVFVQAMQRIEQLREAERFGGWLRTITTRMAINRITRRKIAATCEPQVLEARCVDATTPDAVALERERATQLRAGLGRLRTLDRETLEAFYLRGQSLAEMSDEFDSPIGTIKRRLHVARKRLAKELEDMIAL